MSMETDLLKYLSAVCWGHLMTRPSHMYSTLSTASHTVILDLLLVLQHHHPIGGVICAKSFLGTKKVERLFIDKQKCLSEITNCICKSIVYWSLVTFYSEKQLWWTPHEQSTLLTWITTMQLKTKTKYNLQLWPSTAAGKEELHQSI